MDRSCYYCGALQPASKDRYCRSCGRLLDLPAPALAFGRRYLLSRLDDLVESGALDTAAAARIRITIEQELGVPAGPAVPAASATVWVQAGLSEPAAPIAQSAPPIAPPPAPGRPDNVGPSALELLFTPERAPSLLLYVGAFLIVLAALIFVNVSRQQISDQVRLVLLIVGTLAFLGGGLAAFRVPQVNEAGRTFLIIGALLVPLDFVAYYGLVARVSPLSSPGVWVAGSILAALLYATLAITGYGRVYAQFWFVTCLSGLAGIDALFHVRATWTNVPFALYVIAIELVRRVVPSTAALRLVTPVFVPSRIVAFIALGTGVLIVALASPFDPFDVVPLDRPAMVVLASLAAVYYGLRSDQASRWERWLAVAGPGLIGLALVYAFKGDSAGYGLVLTLIAIAYEAAAELDVLAERPSPFPAWVRQRARVLGYWAIAGAILPLDAYWKTPALGAAAYLGLAALLATLAFRRAVAAPRAARVPDTVNLPTALAAATAHVATFFLTVAIGVLHVGRSTFTGVEPRELAVLIAPLAAALGALTVLAHRRLPILTDVIGLSGVASAAIAAYLATSELSHGTVIGYLAALGVIAVAVAIGRPMVLWIAAAFTAVGGWSLVRWLQTPDELRPPLIAFWAVVFFGAAFLPRVKANPFARVTREIAIVTATASVGLGLLLSTNVRIGVTDPWDTRVWLTTVPALAALGALGVAEGLRRRLERAVLVASVCFLGCAEMLIATLHPRDVEAFAVPVAIYLGLAAVGIARFGSPQLRGDLLIGARVAAAVALVAPTYARSFERDPTLRTEIVLAEGLALLIFAGTLGFDDLVLAAAVVLGAGAWRTALDPVLLEQIGGIFGAATIAYLVFVPSRPWRARGTLREGAEAVAVALLLGAPLMRAAGGGSDSLDHAMVVLASGAALVGIALWAGRRMLLSAAMVALGAIGLVALRDPASTELYVAVTGAVLVSMLYGMGGLGPSRVPARAELALEILAAALILSGALSRALSPPPEALTQAWLVLAEGAALLVVGGALRRRMLAAGGALAIALIGLWSFGDPTARQFHAVAAGAGLIAAALGAIRYGPRDLDGRAFVAAEIAGATFFAGPTILATWNSAFLPGTIVVFFEIALLLGTGIVLARRWLVAAALGALGIETMRATIDVANRLPNWALFGASGALLLSIGFALLVKREAWNAWSRRAYAWWTEL